MTTEKLQTGLATDIVQTIQIGNGSGLGKIALNVLSEAWQHHVGHEANLGAKVIV